MENYIIIAVVILIIGLAGLYIYKAKKSGRKCIGCPDNKNCSGSCSSCNSCCSHNSSTE
ncbi:MAG: FeoB-associated Cys-rich membrane protein [Clostridia bacterium]|nr:FeoB-associated Cys-rich membrane protein [Clostridia bacterium]